LKVQQAISSIALFGSWSRGDAVRNSDVDVLIVDRRDFDSEYLERMEFEGLLVDLNYIPEKWLRGRIPPEIDQKIYEVDVLYDRDQRLARTKSLMEKTHWTHDRVDMRTESYLIDAYTYLSRASSAENKGDLRSSAVYATLGLEEILKTLIEVNMLPVSNSHFIEALERSAKELGMYEVFDRYLDHSGLSTLNRSMVEDGLSNLEVAWNDAIALMRTLDSSVRTLHDSVRKGLNYYLKPEFLKGLTARTKDMIDDDAFLEAGHYIRRAFVDMLENFSWLALAETGARFDYTTLFDSVGGVDSCRPIYQRAVKTFRLDYISRTEVEASLKKAKENVHTIRQKRKDLISRYVKPTA